MKTQWEGGFCKLRREPAPEPAHVGTWIVDFPASRTVRKPISVVQATLSVVLCHDRPSRLMRFLKENMGRTWQDPEQGLNQGLSYRPLPPSSPSPPLPTLPASALFPHVVRDNTTTSNPSHFWNRDPRKTRALFQAPAWKIPKSSRAGLWCTQPTPDAPSWTNPGPVDLPLAKQARFAIKRWRTK